MIPKGLNSLNSSPHLAGQLSEPAAQLSELFPNCLPSSAGFAPATPPSKETFGRLVARSNGRNVVFRTIVSRSRSFIGTRGSWVPSSAELRRAGLAQLGELGSSARRAGQLSELGSLLPPLPMKESDRDTIVRRATLRPSERAMSRANLSSTRIKAAQLSEQGSSQSCPGELGSSALRAGLGELPSSESCPAELGELPSLGSI